MTWICWGRLYGKCGEQHETRELARAHAWVIYKAIKGTHREDHVWPHLADCRSIRTRGLECECPK